jgi:hypothetical protein
MNKMFQIINAEGQKALQVSVFKEAFRLLAQEIDATYLVVAEASQPKVKADLLVLESGVAALELDAETTKVINKKIESLVTRFSASEDTAEILE